MENDERLEHHLSFGNEYGVQYAANAATYDVVWLSQTRDQRLTDIRDCSIIRPSSSYDWVHVLEICEANGRSREYRHTLAFVGAAFGLQASLTILSKLDMVVVSRDGRASRTWAEQSRVQRTP